MKTILVVVDDWLVRDTRRYCGPAAIVEPPRETHDRIRGLRFDLIVVACDIRSRVAREFCKPLPVFLNKGGKIVHCEPTEILQYLPKGDPPNEYRLLTVRYAAAKAEMLRCEERMAELRALGVTLPPTPALARETPAASE